MILGVIVRSGAAQQIWRVRYYALALIAQRGVPILLLPWFVSRFGKDEFADYTLLYAATQITGTLIGIGLPLAVVPLWHGQPNKDRFIATCLQTSIIIALPLFIFACLTIPLPFWPDSLFGLSPLVTLTWLFAFAVAYNANIVALAVARCEERAVDYFSASIIAAALLVAGLSAASFLGYGQLSMLLAIQFSALLGMTLLLFGKRLSRLPAVLLTRSSQQRDLIRVSRPLAANALLLLLAMSIDKWVAKTFFDRTTFSAYVIDYQAAFTLMFVPTALGTYLGPRFSAAVANGEWSEIQRETRAARFLIATGSIAIAMAMYFYSTITGLGLTHGYWVLVLAFLIEGQYAVLCQLNIAHRAFDGLLRATICGLSAFAVMLGLASLGRNTHLLYVSPLLYELVIFAFAMRSLRRHSINEVKKRAAEIAVVNQSRE